MKYLTVMMALTVALTASDAWAKRFGGGGSFGKQSTNVMQRNTPAQPAQAPRNANQATNQNANTANRPNQAGAAQQASRPWGAMLGGLAAGLGLAWLASSLGFGEGFGQFLLIMLLVMAGFALFRMLRRPAAGMQSPMSFQGNGSATMPGSMPSYSPKNVGNDASARPWEAGSHDGGSMIGSALQGAQTWGIPDGFDAEGFLAASKKNFVSLQKAWDSADINALRTMMTDEMLSEIKGQLAEREQQGGAATHTEVVMLEAQLLGIEEFDHEYMASVEFSGMMSEDPFAGPTAFREVWNITKPKAGGGWRVAGLQAMQ
jgi:predicted lipid-binding transport protein (Tim44 family)